MAKDLSNGNASAVEANSDSAPDQGRVQWGGKIEFLLTLIGYAVGLGNIWRFPYLCYENGGGAFLIPYFLTLALVGLPLFFMEVSFGQFASLGPVKIWSINPMFKGLGLSMVITNTLLAIYYNVIVAWILYFLFASMNSEVPWATCDNSWNTPLCILTSDMPNITGNYTLSNGTIVAKSALQSPSEEYFYNGVLQLSSGINKPGTIVWQLALCLLLAWMIVFCVLIKGISSLGKVVYFTTSFPYILLTVMLIRGCTLSGARDGIIYYLKPNWDKLGEATVWSDAATQIFFSLSLAAGGLIAMASYNEFNNNCLRDSIAVPLINCGTSFYGGFAIFSVLGYMANQKGVPVSDVAASGPGLVFVVYPEALATMPVAPLWSILFFFMMLTLGLSSMFSIVETFFCAFSDEFPSVLNKTPLHNIIFRIISTIVFYLIGLSMVDQGGFYVFNIFDSYIGGFPFLFIGFFEIIAICFIYGWTRFAEDAEMMLGKKPSIYFRACLSVIAPLLILAIIIFLAVQYDTPTLFSGAYSYPTWGEGIGFAIVGICLVSLPAWMIYVLIRHELFRRNILEVLKESSSPTAEWKPRLPENQTGRYDPNYVEPPKIAKTSRSAVGVADVESNSLELTGVKPLDENVFVTSEPKTPPPAYDNPSYLPDNQDNNKENEDLNEQ